MSLLKTIEGFFGEAKTELTSTITATLSDVQAGFKTTDELIGTALDYAQTAGEVLELIPGEQALGASIATGAAAVTALNATLEAAFAAGSSDVVTLGKQVVQLLAMAGTLIAQAAPFIQTAGKQAAAVDSAAVAAVKALPAIPATV